MNKKVKVILTSILSVLSVITTLAMCMVRVGFVFVDHYVFDGFCYLLFALFIVNTVVLFFQLRGSLLENKLFNTVVLIINSLILLINLGCIAAFLIIGNDDITDYFYVSLETLPYLALFYALIFLTLILPAAHRILHKLTAGVVAASIAVTAIVVAFPAGGFGFEGKPAVFDDGNAYHIIFATNRKSVGYVKLSGEGGERVIWDTIAGRKDSARIHSVRVDYDELENAEYSVGAVRVLEDIAYGGHLGKEVEMNVGNFIPCPEDGFEMTCVTDNHTARPDWSKVGENADIVAFLGDISSGVYSQDSIIDNLLVPAGTVSGGTKPVIYNLGNHDHRGSNVPVMLNALDFDGYYFRRTIGKYVFTVLDSGEDKEDENYEYAGYNDFAPYFDKQTEWLASLEKENGYNVLITHSSCVFFEPDDKPTPAAEVLRELGVDFTICGHSHTTEYVSARDSVTGIQYYICGAKDENDPHEINYTNMTFNNGTVDIRSINTKGDVLCEKQINLTEVK